MGYEDQNEPERTGSGEGSVNYNGLAIEVCKVMTVSCSFLPCFALWPISQKLSN